MPGLVTVKPYLYGGVLLALIAGGWYLHHRIYASGEAAGAARVQADWDAASLVITAAAIKQSAANAEADRQARKSNAKVIAEYEAQLTAARAGAARDALSLRLAYEAPGRANRVSKDHDRPGLVAGGEIAERTRRLDGLTANAIEACRSDAAQLNALVAELAPQL